MVENLPKNIKVGIVNVSVAGCKIELYDKDNYLTYTSAITEDWLKNIIKEYNGNPYGYLVEVAKLAQKDGVIKGILLHQGESNTGDGNWPLKVKAIYTNLIKDLNLKADSVPLLAGEVVNADQGGVCASMNSIIAKLPQTLPNSYVISSKGCTDATDNIHFNSAGYRKLGIRYAVKMLSLLGYESVYMEAECATVGANWDILADAKTSNGSYVTVESGKQSISEAPVNEADVIHLPFTVTTDSTYQIYGLLNCATTDDDSYWLKMDDGEFVKCEGLVTTGWQWKNLYSYKLTPGKHILTIAYSEDGAKLDKICIKNALIAPVNMGGEAANLCKPVITAIEQTETYNGYALDQNYPNPFNEKTSISFTIPNKTQVSLKVFNMLGVEIVELGGKEFDSGKHIIEFKPEKLLNGSYFYRIMTDKFSATREMLILNE